MAGICLAIIYKLNASVTVINQIVSTSIKK